MKNESPLLAMCCASQILIKMTRGTFQKTVESAEYDFIRDKAQKETIELLAKTLIEVRKHMTAHIPEKVFDMVDDALAKSGFTA